MEFAFETFEWLNQAIEHKMAQLDYRTQNSFEPIATF